MNENFSLSDTKAAVDTYITALLDKRISQANVIHTSYGDLWRDIKRVYLAGGKRIRPYLTVIGNGGLNDEIVPIAAAQELLHVAVLMHDDIIDQDDTRHGTLNVNGAYAANYGVHLPHERVVHYANGAALLAGDALISEAYSAVLRSGYNLSVTGRVCERLARSIFEVIGGELMDVESGFATGNVYDPLSIYHYKTASYSFNGPLLAGAYCAGLDELSMATLETVGSRLGTAFQIQDDLLGVFGNDEETGKSTYTDLREAKRTLLVAQHEVAMNADQRERFQAYFGAVNASDEALELLKQDIEASGARSQAQATADQYFREAEAALSALADGPRKEALAGLMQRLQARRS